MELLQEKYLRVEYHIVFNQTRISPSTVSHNLGSHTVSSPSSTIFCLHKTLGKVFNGSGVDNLHKVARDVLPPFIFCFAVEITTRVIALDARSLGARRREKIRDPRGGHKRMARTDLTKTILYHEYYFVHPTCHVVHLTTKKVNVAALTCMGYWYDRQAVRNVFGTAMYFLVSCLRRYYRQELIMYPTKTTRYLIYAYSSVMLELHNNNTKGACHRGVTRDSRKVYDTFVATLAQGPKLVRQD